MLVGAGNNMQVMETKQAQSALKQSRNILGLLAIVLFATTAPLAAQPKATGPAVFEVSLRKLRPGGLKDGGPHGSVHGSGGQSSRG